jgi:hypothetical protein
LRGSARGIAKRSEEVERRRINRKKKFEEFPRIMEGYEPRGTVSEDSGKKNERRSYIRFICRNWGSFNALNQTPVMAAIKLPTIT